MFLTRSSRMELLLDALSAVVDHPRSRFFEPEIVVVQSLGIERWLAQRLSERLGVWANAVCPFPRAFARSLVDRVLGAESASARWEREPLGWTMARHLATLEESAEFRPLRRYLAASGDLRGRLALATRIAQAFDQYQAYRPDWLEQWALGNDVLDGVDAWQPLLFRRLVTELGPHHFAARVEQCIEVLSGGGALIENLPERVCLFAVASVPPLFVRLFDALGQLVPVHWFLLSAGTSSLAGGETAAPGDGMRRTNPGDAADGVRLLGGLSHTLRDFEEVLRGAGALSVRELAPEAPQPEESLLSSLTGDLRRGRGRGGSTGSPPRLLDATDRSLSVHACHGPQRELEVLRESLLDAFERDPSLGPEDVLVMLRDVEAYAPLVQAVFGQPGDAGQRLPYCVVDRAERIGNEAMGAVVAILSALRLRLTASAVAALLDLSPLRRRFGIEESDVSTLCRWIERLELRWGVDGADRLSEGQPPYEQRTLRTGIRRLLLGVACDSEAERPFLGLMPFPVHGDETRLLECFGSLMEGLFAWQRQVRTPRTVSEWEVALGEMVDLLLLVPKEHHWQIAEIRRALSDLSEQARVGAFSELVDVEVMGAMLRERFEEPRPLQPFFSGGITFCAMLPMRGIPFRFIAMLGLNDGAFPRQPKEASLDGTTHSPRVGDRSVRSEDRHLFLETLLGVRERLWLSYVGQSPRDDSILPPSVLIEELLAEIDRGFVAPADQRCRASQLVQVRHPLRTESPRYFDGSDPRLVSRSRRAFRAARASCLPLKRPSGVLGGLLPQRPVDELALGVLAEFLGTPGDAFLRDRLGVEKVRAPSVLCERESTELAALAKWRIRETLMKAAMQHGSGVVEQIRSRGWLPPGALGETSLAEPLRDALALADTARQLGWESPTRSVGVSLLVDGLVLSGRLGDVRGDCRIDVSPSRSSTKDRVRAYVLHLALCAGGEPVTTWFLRRHERQCGRTDLSRLDPIAPERALATLTEYVRLYRVGQRGPLPFFGDLSWNYTKQVRKQNQPRAALAKARMEFEASADRDGDSWGGEVWSDALARLFGGEPPLDDDWPQKHGLVPLPCFAECSTTVCGPIVGDMVSVDDGGPQPRDTP